MTPQCKMKCSALVSLMKTAVSWLSVANLALLVIGLPGAVLADQSAPITASGTVPGVVSVELPTLQTSTPPEIAGDGSFMVVEVSERITLTSTIPGRIELSRVQLEAPNGVNQSAVLADITLVANGSPLVAASTSDGGSSNLGTGLLQATVSAKFYSTTNQPLPAGTYKAISLLTVIAE